MRNARCACGTLTATTSAEPQFVVACHCDDCQLRTGSPFGVGAYFKRDDVTFEGESKIHERTGDAGRWLRNHFCPNCGTTLYWLVEFRPDLVAVAAGCFTDPKFPAPNRSVFMRSRHDWVEMPSGIDSYDNSSF